jgi:hypothetical protein
MCYTDYRTKYQNVVREHDIATAINTMKSSSKELVIALNIRLQSKERVLVHI